MVAAMDLTDGLAAFNMLAAAIGGVLLALMLWLVRGRPATHVQTLVTRRALAITATLLALASAATLIGGGREPELLVRLVGLMLQVWLIIILLAWHLLRLEGYSRRKHYRRLSSSMTRIATHVQHPPGRQHHGS